MKGATWTQLSRWWNPGNEADQFIMNTKNHMKLLNYIIRVLYDQEALNAIKLHTHAHLLYLQRLT